MRLVQQISVRKHTCP